MLIGEILQNIAIECAFTYSFLFHKAKCMMNDEYQVNLFRPRNEGAK